MNQALHIFAKDTRRFWPEILISIALLAAFAYVSPLSYQPGMRDSRLILYPAFNLILSVLIPVTWWVLVSRVVYEENLVGDRQFWITRPYQWPSLLFAKILFLVSYILVPICLTQSFVLLSTGFHPLKLSTGLLFSVALLGTLVILPLFALSTITASFARLTVTLVGIVLTMLVFGALISNRTTSIDVSAHAAWPYILLSLVASGTIVLLQYARRRTNTARLVLLASLIFLTLLPLFFSAKLTPLYFPPATGSRPPPVAMTFDPNPGRRSNGTSANENAQYISLSLPVSVNGVAPNSLAVAENIRFTLTSADGKTYTSPWRSFRAFYRPDSGPKTTTDNRAALKYVGLLVPKAFFDQVRSVPVTASITLGVAQLKPQASVTVPFPSEETEMPGIGICSGGRNTPDYDSSSYNLGCTVALRTPVYTELAAHWSDYKCNQPQPPADQLITGDGSIGSFDSDPADFGLSPLIHQQINFDNGVVQLPNSATRARYLCSGTPLTLTPYKLAYRASVTFTASNLHLADYLPKLVDNVGRVQLQSITPAK